MNPTRFKHFIAVLGNRSLILRISLKIKPSVERFSAMQVAITLASRGGKTHSQAQGMAYLPESPAYEPFEKPGREPWNSGKDLMTFFILQPI